MKCFLFLFLFTFQTDQIGTYEKIVVSEIPPTLYAYNAIKVIKLISLNSIFIIYMLLPLVKWWVLPYTYIKTFLKRPHLQTTDYFYDLDFHSHFWKSMYRDQNFQADQSFNYTATLRDGKKNVKTLQDGLYRTFLIGWYMLFEK